MVLQVVALMVRLSSMVNKIRLLAVTAEVSTTSVGFVPAGTATAPAAAEPHTAGEAPLAQLVVVFSVVPLSVVKLPPAGVVLPMAGGAAKSDSPATSSRCCYCCSSSAWAVECP